MTSKDLNESYQSNKQKFHEYIDKIKKNSSWDLYTIVNATLIKNPYTSIFPFEFFRSNLNNENKILLFIKSSTKFYLRNFYLLISYFVAFIIYKIYYKKKRKNELKIIIDTFGLVDKVNKEEKVTENYLTGIYEIFEEYKTEYAILLRPYLVGKNPFKLRQFFTIINNDKRDFIFEYELLKVFDFVRLFGLVVMYPFKTLRLLQKEDEKIDNIFNHALLADIKAFNFESFTRYILGKNLAKINSIEKIYSWSEFQIIERSFNYAIRKNFSNIKLIGLQFYLNMESMFHTSIDDIDYDMLTSPHKVLVNGKYYVMNREKVKYDTGVSLRYKDIFNFKGIEEEKNILLLGSYIESDTKNMINSVKEFDHVIFKNHPAINLNTFEELPINIEVSIEDIYTLFINTKLVIGTASGTVVEAVACGLSVIIIASVDNLTANPLIEYGQGEIWDIVYDINEIEDFYKKLINFRIHNPEKINEIANWYKENFFIEPTKQKIIETFELQKRNN